MASTPDVQPKSRITAKNILYWCGTLCICTALAGISFTHFDVPVARAVFSTSVHIQHLADGLAGKVLVAGESLVFLLIVLFRHIHGTLPKIIRVLAIACLTSICAYAFNGEVLKWIFGVPNPGGVLNDGAIHAFHLFTGTNMSSFPSGHMMLAGGFGGAFMYIYPKSRIFLCALLAIGMCLLVIGGWHFISDVIIGTFLGVTAGLLAGEVWGLHISGLDEGTDT